MSIEQTANNKCPQCDGTGKESIFSKHTCCRRCKGTGIINRTEKEASFMGVSLIKSSNLKPIEKQSQSKNNYDSVDYVNPEDEDNDFLKMLEDFEEDDELETPESPKTYRLSYDEESNGIDNSLIISQSKSDEYLRRGIISMVRTIDNSNAEKLITSFQKIIQSNSDSQTNPDSQTKPLPNAKKAITYVYNCLNNMNSEQLRLAFCITRQFM